MGFVKATSSSSSSSVTIEMNWLDRSRRSSRHFDIDILKCAKKVVFFSFLLKTASVSISEKSSPANELQFLQGGLISTIKNFDYVTNRARLQLRIVGLLLHLIVDILMMEIVAMATCGYLQFQ